MKPSPKSKNEYFTITPTHTYRHTQSSFNHSKILDIHCEALYASLALGNSCL